MKSTRPRRDPGHLRGVERSLAQDLDAFSLEQGWAGLNCGHAKAGSSRQHNVGAVKSRSMQCFEILGLIHRCCIERLMHQLGISGRDGTDAMQWSQLRRGAIVIDLITNRHGCTFSGDLGLRGPLWWRWYWAVAIDRLEQLIPNIRKNPTAWLDLLVSGVLNPSIESRSDALLADHRDFGRIVDFQCSPPRSC
jgi:hypothetical protein